MLKPKMIRDHLFVFVNALIVNPAFSSQTKEVLTTKSSQFGSKCVLPDDIMKRLMNKLKGFVKDLLHFKLDQAAKKTDGKRKRKLNLPPEIDDANHAGGRYSNQCTLIITEGLSAKTLAVAGITELPQQKDRWGIFPLKGKLLNVRDASRSQINKNTEINNLKQTLGLKHGTKYDNKKAISTLRYGKIMIMTDQDHDGSHIKGLMINLFHSEWPELIHNKLFGKNGNESFIEQFITPIVVASKGKKKELFYTVPQYEQWKKENNNGKGWKIKYYKGLGTWQRKDGKEHFKHLGTHKIAFKYNNNNDNNPRENENDLAIIKAFDKTKSDLRKEWISSFEPENTFLDFTKLGINGRNKKVSYKDFIDKELILFSVNDLHRSVPSIYDGLKPGQRKILYCAFLKNNLKTEIRVAQLGGYVSEKSAYHHGETSLYQTIIGMAQDYVGSNNINLLSPNGMFGSRMRGGKDAASPRYIHTNLAKITRKLFVNHDDMIVKYQQDDGYPVEPEYYVPIIPMVLINGALGIGTGWSTFIPNYNPKDIIRNIRRKLSGEQWEIIHPFYRGFKGEIKVQTNDDMVNTYSYKIHGKAEIINTFTDNNTNIQYSTIQISELPIQQWTENYKKFLMDLEETEQIENLNNMSSDIDVAFTFDIQHKVKPTKTTKGGRGRKKEKNNDQQSISGSNSVSSSPTRNGSNNNKKSKKKIYFNGTLTDQFLKDMKLITSMSLTNMVLFDINGKIKRYDNVCQILQEFYEGRLSHYSLRKKALLNSMEHQLKKISNQARFIMMIIDDKLVISKRKKFDVIRDLRDHKFDTWIPSKDDGNTLRNRAKATDAFQDDDNNDGDNANDNDKMDIDTDNDKNELKRLAEGYKYLLSMSISSLTKEKVDDLLQKQEETTAKVNELKLKSAKDLWRDDLDQLDIHLKQYDETYKQNIEQMRKDAELKRNKANKNNTNNKTTKGRGRGKRKTTKATASKSKSKSQSKSQSKSKSPTTKTSKITSKVTKNTNSKKKKKKLLSDNNYPSDPFSMAKRNGQKSKSKTKSKSLSNNNYNTIDDDDFDSDQSPSPHISLFERANLKRNSPQKTRKRKRKLLDSSDDESQSDNDNDLEIMEPPRKKRNTLSVASSISSSPSSSSKTSSSKLPLKSKSLNKPKKKGYDSLDDEYDINDDEDEDEDEDIVRKKRRTSPRRTKRNTTKAKYIDEDSEQEDEDEESEYNEENYSRNTRLKKKKTVSVDSDSEYNLDLDEDDLELDEDDDDYSDY